MSRILKIYIFLFVLTSGSSGQSFGMSAEDTSEVQGRWLLTAFTVDGEEVDDDDVGTRVMEFYSDGTMKVYDGDTLDDEGRYEVVGDELRMTRNGIDEPEIAKFSRENDVMRLMPVLPGDIDLIVVLERIGDTVEGE